MTEAQESDAVNSLKLIQTKFPDSWESIQSYSMRSVSTASNMILIIS